MKELTAYIFPFNTKDYDEPFPYKGNFLCMAAPFEGENWLMIGKTSEKEFLKQAGKKTLAVLNVHGAASMNKEGGIDFLRIQRIWKKVPYYETIVGQIKEKVVVKEITTEKAIEMDLISWKPASK